MSIKLFFLIPTLLCLTRLNDGARILGVFVMPGPSHYILGNALMRGLAEAGHDVTMISPFAEKDPPKNGCWRDIVLDGILEQFQILMKDFNPFQSSPNPFMMPIIINTIGSKLTEETLQNAKVQKLLESNEKFDVVILSVFVSEGLSTLAKHFDAHLILFSPTEANMWVHHLVGNPSLSSLYPEIIVSYPLKMSLFQRVKNTFLRIIYYFNLKFASYPRQNQIVRKYLPHAIDVQESLSNISLIFLNSHVSISKPQAHVPNMIEIGGFHVHPPKQLPVDLQQFLDNAKDGVIYFSMGSNLKSKNLPIEVRNNILKAFGKRKEKILWKWEDDVLPGQPPNVFLKKWLPQQDILAHPNVKVFITHGGLLSSTEAVYHGVPTIAIPILGDQQANANLAQELGYCLLLPLPELTEEKLTSLLDEIIHNPKYRENVKARSRIMHDRQIKPIDKAVYWVEYVIRHNGAKHLRVAYMDLMWYQYYMLDVFAVIFGAIFFSIFVFKKTIVLLCRKKSQGLKQKRS